VREELRTIEAAFDRLSDEQREVVTMSRLLGMPHRAIAERVGKAEPAVRQILSRAMARLVNVLAESDG
jgi:RNA polymerase sigma factor (sigma-70 family)